MIGVLWCDLHCVIIPASAVWAWWWIVVVCVTFFVSPIYAELTSLVRKHGRTECYAPYSRPYLSGAWQLLCTASPVAASSQGHHGCLLRWLFRLCSHWKPLFWKCCPWSVSTIFQLMCVLGWVWLHYIYIYIYTYSASCKILYIMVMDCNIN